MSMKTHSTFHTDPPHPHIYVMSQSLWHHARHKRTTATTATTTTHHTSKIYLQQLRVAHASVRVRLAVPPLGHAATKPAVQASQ